MCQIFMNDLLTEQGQQRSRVIGEIIDTAQRSPANRNQIQITIRSQWPNFGKLVKGHFELPYATTMLKQTNLAANFCKIRSKVKFSMCSQIIGD